MRTDRRQPSKHRTLRRVLLAVVGVFLLDWAARSLYLPYAAHRTTSLRGFQAEGVTMVNHHLDGRDFGGAQLNKVEFIDCSLRGSSFYGADIGGARFLHSDVARSDFRSTRARGTDFAASFLRLADFREADLRDAGFRGASLFGADFRGARLVGADFTKARFDKSTKWPDGFKPGGAFTHDVGDIRPWSRSKRYW
jgi:uncharacterized protein YjbI with pentapeptide repeats